MNIAFFVNSVETELKEYTTTRLALSALKRGHDIWYLDCESFVYDDADRIMGLATRPPGRKYKSPETFLAAVQGEDAVRERIDVEDLEVLLLRNDPAADAEKRPWAQTVGVVFGRAAASRGVVVLNDPDGLSRALNKMYLQGFPSEVRPATLITRSADEIRAFAEEHRDAGCVLKPLQGSGGQSVFLVRDAEPANLNQMIEAVCRHGYVVAQEFLPAAAQKDTRMFLVNGRPLILDGHVCAFSRAGAKGDLRTNITAGGSVQAADVTQRMMDLAEMVRPRLVQDGMFLVGLDIAGDRLMEINVFSPGGLGSASHFCGVDFTQPILDAIEAKVSHRKAYESEVPNAELAVL